jgi:hypothetical protein
VSDAAPKFEAWEVVRRARSRIGEDNYRLLTNNCEHFCEWCLRGEPRSYQVEARLALPLRGDRFISRLGDFLVKRPFSAMMVVMVMSAVAAGAACARDVSSQDPTASPNSPVQALVLNGAHAPGSEVAQNPEVNVQEGQPLTAVVVTQCNLVVAVYFTMQDGKLIRFDKDAGSSIKAEDLVTLAYNSAKRSERVEVGCDMPGVKATEPHSRTDL